MKHQVEIIPATLTHVQELATTLNAEDFAEAVNLGVKANRALWRSWRDSRYRMAALVDGSVAGIWGVTGGFLGLTGKIWLITGPAARAVSPLDFALLYRQEVRKMLKIYPRLENIVDDSYERAVKMLRLTGFTVMEPYPVPGTGKLFRLFYKEA